MCMSIKRRPRFYVICRLGDHIQSNRGMDNEVIRFDRSEPVTRSTRGSNTLGVSSLNAAALINNLGYYTV